jgi:membrane-associated phospholipid phosphatase
MTLRAGFERVRRKDMGRVHLYLVAGLVTAMFALPSSARADQLPDPFVQAAYLELHNLFAPADLVGTDRTIDSAQALDLTLAGVRPAAQIDTQLTPVADEVHPTPQHTGLGALVHTTAEDFLAFPKRRSTWVILGIGAGLAGLAHPADTELNSHIVGSRNSGRFFAPGKWIGAAYTQVGASVGLYVVGRYILPPAAGEPRTNKLSHLGFDLLRAQIVSQTFVHALKYSIRRDRPTGECCSFPSGHAATAFAAASVLERHFGYRAAWPTLAAATYVGVSRLHDNRHYLSDVLFGAAVGTATGWTIVGRHGRSNYAVVPVPVRGGVVLAFTRVPHPEAGS